MMWDRTWNIGSLAGKGEVCEELRKRMIDMCCMQEMRWRDLGAMDGGRRYKVWWSGKGNGVGGVEVMLEELCEKLVKVRGLSDRVMTVLIVFEEDVLRLIHGYAPQSGRSLNKSRLFMMS